MKKIALLVQNWLYFPILGLIFAGIVKSLDFCVAQKSTHPFFPSNCTGSTWLLDCEYFDKGCFDNMQKYLLQRIKWLKIEKIFNFLELKRINYLDLWFNFCLTLFLRTFLTSFVFERRELKRWASRAGRKSIKSSVLKYLKVLKEVI